jgi:hypothetical protein
MKKGLEIFVFIIIVLLLFDLNYISIMRTEYKLSSL